DERECWTGPGLRDDGDDCSIRACLLGGVLAVRLEKIANPAMVERAGGAQEIAALVVALIDEGVGHARETHVAERAGNLVELLLRLDGHFLENLVRGARPGRATG